MAFKLIINNSIFSPVVAEHLTLTIPVASRLCCIFVLPCLSRAGSGNQRVLRIQLLAKKVVHNSINGGIQEENKIHKSSSNSNHYSSSLQNRQCALTEVLLNHLPTSSSTKGKLEGYFAVLGTVGLKLLQKYFFKMCY